MRVFENLYGVDIAGRIGMAVVGADHQTVFAGFAHYVRNIIAIFAGHIHAKCAKWILGPTPAEGFEAIPRFMHDPGQPLRARFNETKTKPGKDIMDLAHDNIVEGRDRGNPEAMKRRGDTNRMAIEIIQP